MPTLNDIGKNDLRKNSSAPVLSKLSAISKCIDEVGDGQRLELLVCSPPAQGELLEPARQRDIAADHLARFIDCEAHDLLDQLGVVVESSIKCTLSR